MPLTVRLCSIDLRARKAPGLLAGFLYIIGSVEHHTSSNLLCVYISRQVGQATSSKEGVDKGQDEGKGQGAVVDSPSTDKY